MNRIVEFVNIRRNKFAIPIKTKTQRERSIPFWFFSLAKLKTNAEAIEHTFHVAQEIKEKNNRAPVSSLCFSSFIMFYPSTHAYEKSALRLTLQKLA